MVNDLSVTDHMSLTDSAPTRTTTVLEDNAVLFRAIKERYARLAGKCSFIGQGYS